MVDDDPDSVVAEDARLEAGCQLGTDLEVDVVFFGDPLVALARREFEHLVVGEAPGGAVAGRDVLSGRDGVSRASSVCSRWTATMGSAGRSAGAQSTSDMSSNGGRPFVSAWA